MSGPMRAPSTGYYFFIPYSGTLADGDCVLSVGPYLGNEKEITVIAEYWNGTWRTDAYTTLLADTDHILHIESNAIREGGKAAFIPGPNH